MDWNTSSAQKSLHDYTDEELEKELEANNATLVADILERGTHEHDYAIWLTKINRDLILSIQARRAWKKQQQTSSGK